MRTRWTTLAATALTLALVAGGCSDDDEGGTSAPAGTTPAQASELAESSCQATDGPLEGEAAAIAEIAEQQMDELGLRSALVRVERGEDEVVTLALGESLPGVATEADVHFRNGAVAIAELGTVLLQLVDEGTVSLDDTIDAWLPELPAADQVTLGMLITSTSGYVDYQATDSFVDDLYADPFQRWTPEELIEIGLSQPLWYEPGTNWSYAHTNFVILGEALERITDTPTDQLLTERFLEPAGLTQTRGDSTPAIPEPVLHAYTGERGVYEEGTFWDPSWTLAEGSIQTTDICDLASTARVVGTGELLSEDAYELMVGDSLVGLGGPTDECPEVCRAQTEVAHWSYGVIVLGEWIAQTPSFHGFAGVMAYLPSEELTIAVSSTRAPGTTDDGNLSSALADAIATELTGSPITPQAPPG